MTRSIKVQKDAELADLIDALKSKELTAKIKHADEWWQSLGNSKLLVEQAIKLLMIIKRHGKA